MNLLTKLAIKKLKKQAQKTFENFEKQITTEEQTNKKMQNCLEQIIEIMEIEIKNEQGQDVILQKEDLPKLTNKQMQKLIEGAITFLEQAE